MLNIITLKHTHRQSRSSTGSLAAAPANSSGRAQPGWDSRRGRTLVPHHPQRDRGSSSRARASFRSPQSGAIRRPHLPPIKKAKKKRKVLVFQSCLTLRAHGLCSPPGSSVHGILQAGILEWAAMPSSRASSPHRDQTEVSSSEGGFFKL